jgi:hypothetical protein
VENAADGVSDRFSAGNTHLAGGEKSYSFAPYAEVSSTLAGDGSGEAETEPSPLEKRPAPAEIEPGMDLEELGIAFDPEP